MAGLLTGQDIMKQLAGKELPYDFEELSRQRQAVRDQINELQEKIAALPEEDAE